MLREWLTLMLLASLLGTIANAAPPKKAPSESLGNLLKKEAQRLFELADADHDQQLNLDEQKDAVRRTKNAFSHFVQENTLAGPRVPPKVGEPIIVNPERVTEEEFVQLFQARAAEYDAKVRAERIAKKQVPVQSHVVWNAPYIPTAQEDKRADREERDKRDDERMREKDRQRDLEMDRHFKK
jgi:hypothetical protein